MVFQTQLLLDNGANVNSKTDKGLFSLFLAAKSNNITSLRVLLKRGVRVNATTHRCETALHVACKKGFAEVVALLLDFGADMCVRNRRGKMPLQLLPNRPSSRAILQTIVREAVKRETLGQSLYDRYEQMIQGCENCSKFDQECREEIRRMRSQKIDTEDTNCRSFVYIISIIDEEKLTALARNETIVTAFKSSGASFRIYAVELTKKFKQAYKRAKFISRVEDRLDDVLGGVLPAAVVQKMAAYVKYDDIFAKGLNNDCD